MSLITALDTAVSGLRVSQLQVQNAANNIANASDPNFTKKTAIQASINLADGGGGVQLIGYTRSMDAALSNTYRDALSADGQQTAANNIFSNINDAIGISSDSVAVSSSLADFISSWQSFAAEPEDSVRQRDVVSKANVFATNLRDMSTQLDLVDTSIKQQQGDAIDKVNTDLKSIADLNNQIAAAAAVNEPTGNIEDQRDAVLRDLSGYVKIRVLDGDNGRVRVLTPGGFVMVDSKPVTLKYDNGDYKLSDGTNLDTVLKGGSLEAMYNARLDGSPATPSTDAGTEVIRKLRSQLNALATSFLTTTGTPTSFAAAYNSGTAQSTEQPDNFFTGTGANDLAVNAALLAGSKNVKMDSADSVVNSLTATTRSFTADGLSVSGTGYTGYLSSVIGLFSGAADTIKNRNVASSTAVDTYKQRLANVTGVNVDEELVNLTRLQNSYSASARVITTIRDMFQVLEGIGG